MGHYRKVDVRVWNDAKFMSLTMEGQLAWFNLLTHPMMTSLGAIRATPEGLAAELSRGAEGFREAFREGLQDIIDKGMADYDAKANLITLPSFVKYNKPESPNVVKAWATAADMLPECELKELTIQRAIAFVRTLGKGFNDAVEKAFPKAYPKASLIQRAEKQRAESSDLDLALDEVRDSTEGTYTHETMFTPYPIPYSAAEGKTFLTEKGVPAESMDDCLRRLIGGNLSPFDLEGIIPENRSAA